MRIPSLLISALKGGSGKTLVTVGLTAAIRARGLVPSVFKKGPDYIDAGWLSLSAGKPCYNLDQHLFPAGAVLKSFIRRSLNSDISIIEGNRGLFDGLDNRGSSSSAELAKLLRIPTLMIIDCSKMTGTAAALVRGCQEFDPELQIAGIILNRIKGTRHEHVVRQAIERTSAIPVVGVIPAMKLRNFPQRHLGLLPIQEHPAAIDFVEEARTIIEHGLDLKKIERIAFQGATSSSFHLMNLECDPVKTVCIERIEIGILHDAAFQFYYPENLEALILKGANIVEINSLEPKPLPDIDALYIGGGFPETHAERLAENIIFRESIKSFVESGGPVYAECGGLMLLASSLEVDTKVFPMAGVFSAKSVLNRKPQGLGYAELKAKKSNPFFDEGVTLRGHEFHYSTIVMNPPNREFWAFDVLRGHGIDGAHDGLAIKNALGLYTHIHSLGEPEWAGSIVRKAKIFRDAVQTKSKACSVEKKSSNLLPGIRRMQNAPRIIIGALRGGSGKTLLSIGIAAALRRRGLSVAVFKKGPDYIDSGWLGKAAQRPCRNLDSYLFDKETLKKSFCKWAKDQDVSVIEGNRGLFDGVNASGEYSSAELAKLLKTPVILIVDASKMTRTAAALVLGCQSLDSDVLIKAVILNRVAGPRHEKTLRDSIEEYCSIPVIGVINKLSLEDFPQRHLGLLPLSEHSGANGIVETVASLVERSIDLDCLMKLARSADPLDCPRIFENQSRSMLEHENLRIGILRDSAFQFYYPENLQALTSTGATLVEITALEPRPLPRVDALYIGGGFPETHAEVLAKNTTFKESLLLAIKAGLPVYAECGGLMYLARQLTIDETTYPMVGVFDVETVLERRPQGHGYMVVSVVVSNPFFPVGSELKGHEFHYSFIPADNINTNSYAFKVIRGHGINGSLDGIFRYKALGTYLHLHALGTPAWAPAILSQARNYHEMSCNKTNDQNLPEN